VYLFVNMRHLVFFEIRVFLQLALTIVYFFSHSAIAQSLGSVWQGKWLLNGGASTLLISDKELKFIEASNNDENNFYWINHPPKNGSTPEAFVSDDGSYKVCFYKEQTTSKGELLGELSNEMIDLIKKNNEGQLSLENLIDEISQMSKSLNVINHLSAESFRPITCEEYLYLKDSKTYEELSSGDFSVNLFYDKKNVYQWIRNFAVGGIRVDVFVGQNMR
jgi:hypothetical protein